MAVEFPEDTFVSRHVGPDEPEVAEMLRVVGAASLDALAAETVPAGIRLRAPLALPAPVGEAAVLQELRELAAQNVVARSFIGMGYYDCITPPVILRNILE